MFVKVRKGEMTYLAPDPRSVISLKLVPHEKSSLWGPIYPRKSANWEQEYFLWYDVSVFIDISLQNQADTISYCWLQLIHMHGLCWSLQYCFLAMQYDWQCVVEGIPSAVVWNTKTAQTVLGITTSHTSYDSNKHDSCLFEEHWLSSKAHQQMVLGYTGQPHVLNGFRKWQIASLQRWKCVLIYFT